MPIKTDSLQRKLCDLLNVRGYKPEPKNSEGKTSPTPEDADVIKFTFSQDGNAIDSVWVTIDSSHSLVVYYDDAVMREGNAKTPGLQYDDSWTGLLKQLKNWAQRRQLSFELKNKDHLASDMAQRTSMKKKEQVSEGYYPIGNKASYSDAVPNVKIILQHTRKIEEGEKRYRNISKIFVENTLGERFAVPTTKPGIARVYARHVAEGGSPYDSRGTHITSIVEEYTKMAGFVRATKNNQFNESTQQLIAEGINHYQSLRESLHKMTGHRGYNAYFESWTPTLNEEADDESSLGEMFVQETLDPRIESVMPILSKLQKKISEMKEVTSLEDWADDLIGEATDLKTIPENLGPEQKRVGQLGPTEKVGKKGTIGKLVGANESVGEEVDESWKQKLGAAALAGSMAMGANARVVPGQDEPGVNRLTGKPNIAQVAATDPVPDSAETEKPILKGFSASYLQKAADPNRFGRFMISVEDAKAELDRRAAAWERRSQGDQKINEGFLDEMHADLEELSEEDFEEEYNMTKAEAKEKYSSTGSWLNEQGALDRDKQDDKTAQQRKAERDKQRSRPAQKARGDAIRKGMTQDKDGTYYAKEGVAEGASEDDEYKDRLASIQSLRYDDPPEYAKKYSEILRLFPKEHHLYATGVQKGSYSPGDRGSGTGRIGRVSEDEEMTQKKKEQVVTVKHKDSGKELRIVKTAVPDYQKRGYYPVNEQGVAEGQLDEIFNPSSALAQILRTASQAAGDYIPIGLGAIGTFAATSALAGPVVAAMVGTTVGNSMLQSLQNNQNKIPGFIQKIVEKYFGNDSEGIEFALLHAKAAFLDKPEFRWRAQQWPVTLKKNDAEAIIEKNDKNWLEQHSQKSEQGVTESSDADQFENWKAAVRKQYPNEAGQIKFKGKGFGDSIVAEIPGRDQAFGEFNMGTGEAWVAPLDESQTMVREAQDELEAMLRIIRK